ncbi:MAG: ATP-binding protein [Bacteroidales bacterium]
MKNILPDDLPNPVIIYDSNWKIKQINESATSVLGYSEAAELIGKSFKDILHEGNHDVIDTIYYNLNNKKNRFHNQEIKHLCKDGRMVSLLSRFGIIDNQNSLDKKKYIQSAFYTGEETTQEQQLKKLHCLKILAENVPGLMMLLIDKNHEITCSVGNEKRKHIKIKEVEESKMLEDWLPEGIINVTKPLLKIAFEGTPVSREFNHEKDYYSIRLAPISDQNNDDLCVIILQNISENKIIENKLKVSKEVAEEANKAKSNFIAKMSHEIRTPLNAVIGFTEQLRKTKLNKKQITYLDIVNNSSQHLLSTINDILILSRIESGHSEVDEEPFSIVEVIKAVKDVFELSAREKNLDFQVNYDPAVKEILMGDPAKIRQVLINLIANAIKFTHQGGILVSCSLIKRTNNKLTIRFDVADSGIGITDDNLKRIFQPFHQVDNSLERSYFGSGLGLTISQDQVKSMGGEIKVKSSPAKGSTFSFMLTLKKSKKQLPKYDYDKPLLPDTKLEQVSILYTDDDLVSRMLGKVILNQYKAKCIFASSGEDAIKKYKPGRFDIILLDINMPGTSGVDVAKHIRKIEKGSKNFTYTKIIAMTANVLKKHIKEYLKAGMDDFILKPFSESDLIKKIAFHSTGINSELSETKQGDKLQSAKKDYNLDELLSITKGDKEYTLLMLDTFLENSNKMLDQMKKSYYKDDYLSIAEAAHRLLPSVEQLGFRDASKVLKKIDARYLRKSKFNKDPEMIEHAMDEVKSCIDKISIAREDYS